MTAALVDRRPAFPNEACDWCNWVGPWLVRHMVEEHPPCECNHLLDEHVPSLGCSHGWDAREWGEPMGCRCTGFHEQDGGEP